jgi:Na+/H+ antiporter NhaD/arsenite permease-like protein
METAILIVFILGYISIVMEHKLVINKAASALLTGALCWTIFAFFEPDKHVLGHHLAEHLGEISGILFFLLGAMTLVEVIDAHHGFELIVKQIKTKNKAKLLWIVGLTTFFLSAVLDNLTTAIVMVSLLQKMIDNDEDRWLFAGIVVISSNAGGAWSPIGDVTTTMLWIGGQVTALNIVKELILPSLVCLLVPLLLLTWRVRGEVSPNEDQMDQGGVTNPREQKLVLFLSVAVLIFVPIFKTVTHLPPFLGMLLGVGLVWGIIERLHRRKEEDERRRLSPSKALQKIDTPSILFFMGILLSVACLQSAEILPHVAQWLDRTIGNESIVVMSIGLLSAIVDNVPLVAAAQGMYSLDTYPTDHYFWEFLAYAAGTGGSALIIGSAAGVAAMGMENINFFWYLKRVTWLALAGFFAGALAYMAMMGHIG